MCVFCVMSATGVGAILKQAGQPPHRFRCWCLTWNNYPEDWKDTLASIGGLKQWACQPEISASGTPHIQGVLVFKNAKLWDTMKNVADGKIHWEVCKNLAASKNYCSKLDTSAGNCWTRGFGIRSPVKDPLAGKTLYDWQQDIVAIIAGAVDDRKIYWFYSHEGAVGKSSLVKHLCLKDRNGTILCGGTFKDAEYAIAQIIGKGGAVKCVIFDIPRSREKDGMPLVSYSGMEEIKNGCFFSAKYESAMVLFDSPHMIVFSNLEPDRSKMSSDRWVVRNVGRVLNCALVAGERPDDYE